MRYGFLILTSYVGTKLFGLERTIFFFKRMGERFRRLFPQRTQKDPETIYRAINRGYSWLPLAIRCLDQAIVSWYLFNIYGHKASMKIGVTLSPLSSHAWVEVERKVFVMNAWIPDMQVMADYPAWS